MTTEASKVNQVHHRSNGSSDPPIKAPATTTTALSPSASARLLPNNNSSSGTATAGVTSAPPPPQPANAMRTDATAAAPGRNGPGGTGRGPRTITIHRSSAGFGFTLRHFIVYPPDSVTDCPEEWQRGMSAGLLDPMAPMDTIFVKHIRENGPAVKAGLNTGDQVVSVNGESVMCKSYAQVVQMIQKSGPTLQLVVMPKEHDVLQQCFADTAHNPFTNARPGVVVAGGALPSPTAVHPEQAGGVGGVVVPGALLKTTANNIMSHLPRPKPYQSFQVEAKKPQAAGPVTPVPVAVALPRQSSAGALQPIPAQPLTRVMANSNNAAVPSTPPTPAGGRPILNEEAQARLAAAAALVSKSVRKSADFNSAASSVAGSRGSLAEYPPGGLNQTSKRMSYAGTPTSRSEFILSINSSTPIMSHPGQHGPSSLAMTTTTPSGGQHQQQSMSISTSGLQQPNSHSPLPIYESLHMSSPSLLHQHRDSLTSSKGSLSGGYEALDQQQRGDVMSQRIKKSFEQKEEFLKRPALPYWVNVQEANQTAVAVPREFYAQPQKFSRPVWPPTNPSSSFESLPESPGSGGKGSPAAAPGTPKTTGAPTTTSTPVLTSVEPWSMVFTSSKPTSPSSGLVTNTVPKPFYGSASAGSGGSAVPPTTSPLGNKLFITTLTRIQENIPSADSASAAEQQQRRLDLDIKPKLLHSAPLASPEEFFTPSPTKASQHPLAAVIKRAKQIEASNAEAKAKLLAQQQLQQLHQRAMAQVGKPIRIEVELHPQKPPQHAVQSASVSGNRTVIIGSSKLHCDPPPNDNKSRTNETAACLDDPLARLVKPHHQLDENSNSPSPKMVAAAVAVRRSLRRSSPLRLTKPAAAATGNVAGPPCLQTDIDDVLLDASTDEDRASSRSAGSVLSMSGAAINGPPITSDFELSVLERFDQLLATLGTGGRSSSGSSSSTINGSIQEVADQAAAAAAKAAASHTITASVNRRQKIYVDDDSDRGMRRVSYLKATANPMDAADATEAHAEPANAPATNSTPTIAEHSKGSSSSSASSSNWALIKNSVVRAQTGVQPGMISRLRQYFEDKSRPQPILSAPPPATPTSTSSPSSPKEEAPPSRRPHPPHSIQKLRSLFGDKVVSSAKSPETSNHQPPSPDQPTAGREGWLHVKQTIVDCRRSTDRSWRQLWTRIRSGQVTFYKEKASAAAPSGGGNSSSAGSEDMTIDLRGCIVEVAIYYTKRKHVLRLATSNGLCEYLLQCDDNNDMVLWLDSFQQEQNAVGSDKEDGQISSYSSSEMMLVRQAHEADSAAHGSSSQRRGMGRFTLHRNRSPTGHSPVSKTRKPSLPGNVYNNGGSGTGGSGAGTNGEGSVSSPASGSNNSASNTSGSSSNKPVTWRRKVVQQFKKIQGNSPSYPSGQFGHPPSVPEGATIGIPLEFCPRSSISDNIPLVVELCVGIVEARGMENVGVYRVPGNSVAVNSLTDSLNRGFEGLNTADPRWNDVNVISSLMKSFFRKLPDPLVTSDLYGPLIEASRTESEPQRLVAIKRLIEDLPEPHYSTLRYLIGHLSRVASYGHINKMEARNLAIVFGPTLIRPGDDSTVTMVTDMSHQCRIVETLIDKIDFFFPAVELDQTDTSLLPNSPSQAGTPLSSSVDERKDAYAREIVSSIITAARKKKQSSLDSPNLSDRSAGSTGEAVATLTVKPAEVPTGSAHSLVELGSTGGTPALPVDGASEFRAEVGLAGPSQVAQQVSTPPIGLERKRSASLGGETSVPPPPSLQLTHDLTGITELVVSDGQQCPTPEFRSRTSSGTFVAGGKVPVNPIDAAGIRSYSGLSAVTQERIRLFEQETKALLQRDLAARQRRDGDAGAVPAAAPGAPGVRRLDKKEVDGAWSRAKLEMETDDFLDALADNPSGTPPVQESPASSVIDPNAPVAVSAAAAAEESAKEETKKEPEGIEPNNTLATEEKVAIEEDPVSTASTTSTVTSTITPTSSDEVDSTGEATEPKKAEKGAALVRKSSGTKPAIPVRAGSTISGRTQTPKPPGVANKSAEASPSKTAGNGKTSAAATSSASATSGVKNGRSSSAVVGRSRTVDLGKVGKKPEPPKVVRQMSTSALLGPSASAKVAPSKATPKLNVRGKPESPAKRSSITSGSAKSADEPKKSVKIDDDQHSKMDEPKSLTPNETLSSGGPQSKDHRLVKTGGSEVVDIQPEPLADVGNKVALKRTVENKEASNNKGVKRSDSLTKDEKTENNTKERERSNNGNGRSRRFVQRNGETGLKRRHTVGGTRDFDKVRIRWLADSNDGSKSSAVPAPRWSAWDRLQPLISDEDLNVDRSLKTWMKSERMRTSSPELCRRSEAVAVQPADVSINSP